MNELPQNAAALSRRSEVLAVVFAVCFPSLLTWIYFTLLTDAQTVVQYMAYGSLKVIQFGFPLVWVLRIQRQKLQIRRPGYGGLVWGGVFGVLIMCTMWGLYKYWLQPGGYMTPAVEPIRQKIESLGLNTPFRFIAQGVFYAVVHSLLEEYYWRWFVFGQLRRMVPLTVAVVISSLGFMAHHVILLDTFFGLSSPLTWIFSIAIAFGGAVWALLYHGTGSLYAVWLSHMLADAGIFIVGYDLIRNTLFS